MRASKEKEHKNARQYIRFPNYSNTRYPSTSMPNAPESSNTIRAPSKPNHRLSPATDAFTESLAVHLRKAMEEIQAI